MEKAKKYSDIACSISNKRGRKCPNHPDGYKYRGTSKCWGCDYATWFRTGRPYGR